MKKCVMFLLYSKDIGLVGGGECHCYCKVGWSGGVLIVNLDWENSKGECHWSCRDSYRFVYMAKCFDSVEDSAEKEEKEWLLKEKKHDPNLCFSDCFESDAE